MILFTGKNIKALEIAITASLKASAKKDVRYYLNGICFDFTDGFDVVATDGHRLFNAKLVSSVAESRREETLTFIVATDQAKLLLAQIKMLVKSYKMLLEFEVVFEDDQLKFVPLGVDAKAIVVDQFIDGRFPDWKRVIPSKPSEEERATSCAFDGRYIADMASVAKLFSKTAQMEIFMRSNNSSTLIEFKKGDEFDAVRAVVMPLRL